MNIYYVTYPSEKPWCSDFTAENLAKYSVNNVTPTTQDKINGINDSIIHFHNVQILGKWLRPLHFIDRMHERGNKVIAGLRGAMGYGRHDNILSKCDAVSVGFDQNLRDYALNLNPNVYTLPPGEDPDIFKPLDIRKTSYLCWAGRDHKQFKNAKLIHQIGYTYKLATYNNYIPHHQLPTFYNSSHICIGFSDHEGFWRPCIEAAMCGLPVISTKVGIVPEIIDEEYIIPHPAKKHINKYREIIKNILNDGETAKKIGIENRKKALKYSWEKVTQLHDKAWSEIF